MLVAKYFCFVKEIVGKNKQTRNKVYYVNALKENQVFFQIFWLVQCCKECFTAECLC